MRRALLLGLALITLTIVWLGPLPGLAPRRFSAHMTMHMAVVAVAAPLLAAALAGGRFDPARRLPALFTAIPASVAELIIVWSWHSPALHHAARGSAAGLVIEQGMFLGSGFWVWMSAVGGARTGERLGSGVVALLLTSMHMTLLGALIALSPRPLFAHSDPLLVARTALDDQHLGGAIMLGVGGLVYLAGGVGLSALVVNRHRRASSPAAPRRGAA